MLSTSRNSVVFIAWRQTCPLRFFIAHLKDNLFLLCYFIPKEVPVMENKTLGCKFANKLLKKSPYGAQTGTLQEFSCLQRVTSLAKSTMQKIIKNKICEAIYFSF